MMIIIFLHRKMKSVLSLILVIAVVRVSSALIRSKQPRIDPEANYDVVRTAAVQRAEIDTPSPSDFYYYFKKPHVVDMLFCIKHQNSVFTGPDSRFTWSVTAILSLLLLLLPRTRDYILYLVTQHAKPKVLKLFVP